MPARRGKNLRSGDWNEDLGLLLLKAVAAVAPVPRQEDFGLDAVATLLHDKGDKFVYAEEAFYVQLKSDSCGPVVYTGQQIQWLRQLQLPLFIGIVSKTGSSLSLYPAHKLNVLLSPRKFEEAKVHLDEGHLSASDKKVNIYLGPPLLKYNIKKASDPTYLAKAYTILKAYLIAEHRNLTFRPLVFWRSIEWRTNQLPKLEIGHFTFVSRDTKPELNRIVDSLLPGFHALACYAKMLNSRSVVEALASLTEELRMAGSDHDQFSIFEDELIAPEPQLKPLF